MFDFIYRQSDISIFLIVSAISITISSFSIIIIRHFINVRVNNDDNPVLGNIASLIGIIYGVLAGLVALYLLNNINYTNDVVQREANAAANIYHDSRLLNQPARNDIEKQLKSYLKTVITIEWPQMQNDSNVKTDGNIIIENILTSSLHYAHLNSIEPALLHDILTEVKSLYNAREQRIQLSRSSLGGDIWLVILIGTFLTIFINFFFRMSYHLHIVGLLAEILMTSAMIFLLIALDKPFQGEFVIMPNAFQSLLSYIEAHPTE